MGIYILLGIERFNANMNGWQCLSLFSIDCNCCSYAFCYVWLFKIHSHFQFCAWSQLHRHVGQNRLFAANRRCCICCQYL